MSDGKRRQLGFSFNDNMSRPKIEPCLEDTSPIPFGQYKGRPMQNVPASYLLYCWDQSWLAFEYPEVYAYINNSLVYLKDKCPDWIEKR